MRGIIDGFVTTGLTGNKSHSGGDLGQSSYFGRPCFLADKEVQGKAYFQMLSARYNFPAAVMYSGFLHLQQPLAHLPASSLTPSCPFPLPAAVIFSKCGYDCLNPMAAPTLLPASDALDAPRSSKGKNPCQDEVCKDLPPCPFSP